MTDPIFTGLLRIAAISATLGLCFNSSSFAMDYRGRITTGGFISGERFSTANDQGTTNDFATMSSRVSLEASRFFREWELTADIRDKYSYFDKLDKDLLELTPENTLQIRQLSLRIPESQRGFYGMLGRFAISDAGAVNADGAEVGYRFDSRWRLSAFGGMNSKREDQTYVQYNPGCEVFGGYLVFQPTTQNWGTSYYLTNSLVTEVNYGNVDRRYWFENLVLQPDPANRFIALTYLDFEPLLELQSAILSYSHDFNYKWSTSVGISSIDAIQFYRLQSVLTQYSPSPYREGTVRAQYRANPVTSIELKTDYGVRQIDGAVRRVHLATVQFSQFGNRHFSSYFSAGWRREFTSSDWLGKLGFGYYSDRVELTLDATFASEKFDSGVTLTPLTAEVGTAIYITRSLYGTVSVQGARNENVGIISTFFKLGYRFGTKEVSPVRDGSPPRGKI